MKRTSAVLVVILAASLVPACHKAPPSVPTAATTGPASTLPAETKFDLDLDGDAKPDTIILQHSSVLDEPGKFRHLTVKFANGKVAEESGSWDDARKDEFPWSGNLLPTQSIYVAKFSGAGTLLFLFGDDVSCCLQSLDIFQVRGSNLVPYYSRKEFTFTKELRPQPDEVTLLTGFPSLTEHTDSSAPDASDASSYLPTVIVRLGERAEVDVEASAEATRQRLGGFSGTDYREDILSITTTTGEHYLWNEKEKKRLP